MCKLSKDVEAHQNVDYIYCLKYYQLNDLQNNYDSVNVNETSLECNLAKRQRSSQEILDLADYLVMHSNEPALRRYTYVDSFSAKIPLWVELANTDSFFDYFKDFVCDDTTLIWDEEPDNLFVLEDFCRKMKWVCTNREKITGSEASTTILYDFDGFDYEALTRAKTQFVIVTIYGQDRYLSALITTLIFYEIIFVSSELSKLLKDIGNGKHDDRKCKKHCKQHMDFYGLELECEFKGNESKIQKLIRKVHVDANGVVTEVQFDNLN